MKNCKNCGNIINSLDKRNVFCSRSCSASYTNRGRVVNEETKRKISDSILNARVIGKSKTPTEGKPKIKISKFCIACGKEFKRWPSCKHKTCSTTCRNDAYNKGLYDLKGKSGGYRRGSGRGKSGWYRGIWCDSSYELAWVMYHLDHNIPFERNKMPFQYEYQNEIHSYYPDFLLLAENKLVEIKGFYTGQTRVKLKSVKGIKLTVIDKDSIFPYMEYAITNYGKDFIRHYDK